MTDTRSPARETRPARSAPSARSRAALAVPDEATRQALMAAVLRHVDIERIDIGTGTTGALDIARITLDDATVREVVLAGVSTRVSCGSAVLHDVRAILELDFTAHWSYDLKWLGGDEGVKTLGSKATRIELHDIRLPMLQDFVFEIPETTIEEVEAELEPIENLSLGGSRLAGVRVESTRLPTEGFALHGLDVGRLDVTGATVPGSGTRRVGIDEFEPAAPLTLPGVTLGGIEIPAIGIPDTSSAGAVSILGAALEAIEAPVFKIGDLFRIKLVVEPVLHLQIGELALAELEASAAVASVTAHDIGVSASVAGVSVDELDLRDIAVSRVEVRVPASGERSPSIEEPER